ncbi:MAG: flagellar basal body P-ring protein FlgI [Pirellulales bacterium]|nr:flagellar basal body P-ring protein FlgI [Pirellulales bacterium]
MHDAPATPDRHPCGSLGRRWIGPCLAVMVLAQSLTCLPLPAATLIKHIVRLKGQEEVTIQGMGLVVGLNGTGDGPGYAPAIRGLAAMLQKLGNPISTERGLLELKDAKNVALVMVTATIPATGARQGDLLEATVSSVGAAKSLEHGYLLSTALLSPQAGQDRVFGIAQGTLQLDNPRAKTVARIRQGCRLEEDFFHDFVKDDKITLVLNKSHADFQVAQELAEQINSQLNFNTKSGQLARALDQVNIEVQIPPQYKDDVVDFVAQVMSRPLLEPETGGRVIINERVGTIAISGDVEIGAVAVTHKNMVIETPGVPSVANRIVGVETAAKPTAKLKSLVEALNALKVTADDQIAIIKIIERDGKLHGTLIIE